MSDNKTIKTLFMHSYLLSRGYDCDNSFTTEDIDYIKSSTVSDCLIDLYMKVISMLSVGESYDNIEKFIDSYCIDYYLNLKDNQKEYVKTKVKKDLNKRKMSFKKGEDINE